MCETAIKKSGYFSSMSFNNTNTGNAQRNTNRKVIWFNPTCRQNLKTNICKLFIKLVRKHSLKNNKFYKIFNIEADLLLYHRRRKHHQRHNFKVLIKTNNRKNRKCNCPSNGECLTQCLVYKTNNRKCNCPSNGECLTQCLVYKTTSSTFNSSSVYYGTSEGEYKTQYNNHTKSFWN